MILIVDNGSAYIEKLCDAIDLEYELKSYNCIERVDGYDAVILSGRMKNDKSMNIRNMSIVRECYTNKLPLLGICYGAEIITLALGGTIRKLDNKVYGLNRVILNENPLIEKVEILVFENHNYIIARPPQTFRVIASSSNNENEIIMDKDALIFGVQFHPELSDDGKMLISNFIRLSMIHRNGKMSNVSNQ